MSSFLQLPFLVGAFTLLCVVHSTAMDTGIMTSDRDNNNTTTAPRHITATPGHVIPPTGTLKPPPIIKPSVIVQSISPNTIPSSHVTVTMMVNSSFPVPEIQKEIESLFKGKKESLVKLTCATHSANVNMSCIGVFSDREAANFMVKTVEEGKLAGIYSAAIQIPPVPPTKSIKVHTKSIAPTKSISPNIIPPSSPVTVTMIVNSSFPVSEIQKEIESLFKGKKESLVKLTCETHPANVNMSCIGIFSDREAANFMVSEVEEGKLAGIYSAAIQIPPVPPTKETTNNNSLIIISSIAGVVVLIAVIVAVVFYFKKKEYNNVPDIPLRGMETDDHVQYNSNEQ